MVSSSVLGRVTCAPYLYPHTCFPLGTSRLLPPPSFAELLLWVQCGPGLMPTNFHSHSSALKESTTQNHVHFTGGKSGFQRMLIVVATETQSQGGLKDTGKAPVVGSMLI